MLHNDEYYIPHFVKQEFISVHAANSIYIVIGQLTS